MWLAAVWASYLPTSDIIPPTLASEILSFGYFTFKDKDGSNMFKEYTICLKSDEQDSQENCPPLAIPWLGNWPFSNLHACSLLTLELRRPNALCYEVMAPQIHKKLNLRRNYAEMSEYLLYHNTQSYVVITRLRILMQKHIYFPSVEATNISTRTSFKF
jgi:hypothetical protein